MSPSKNKNSKEKLFNVWLRLKPYSKFKPIDQSSPVKQFKGSANTITSSNKKSSFSSNTNYHSSSRKKTNRKGPRVTANDTHLLKGDYKALEIQRNGDLEIKRRRRVSREKYESEKKTLNFPSIFKDSVNNKNIFDKILRKKVENSFDGVGFSLITYGISGSGKTHTILGSYKTNEEWEDGMVYMTAKEIFRAKRKRESHGISCRVKASFIEIYNERVYDLLSSQNERSLSIVENPASNGVTINDLEEREVRNFKDLKKMIKVAQAKRVVSPSLNNQMSSRLEFNYCNPVLRSHMIVEISIELSNKSGRFESKIRFVDLAGSEKVSN